MKSDKAIAVLFFVLLLGTELHTVVGDRVLEKAGSDRRIEKVAAAERKGTGNKIPKKGSDGRTLPQASKMQDKQGPEQDADGIVEIKIPKDRRAMIRILPEEVSLEAVTENAADVKKLEKREENEAEQGRGRKEKEKAKAEKQLKKMKEESSCKGPYRVAAGKKGAERNWRDSGEEAKPSVRRAFHHAGRIVKGQLPLVNSQ